MPNIPSSITIKIVTSIFFAILILPLTACLPRPGPPPFGVWHNEEHGITLYIEPEFLLPHTVETFVGTINQNNLTTNLIVRFTANVPEMGFIDRDAPTTRLNPNAIYPVAFAGEMLIYGDFRLDDDDLLYFNLDRNFRRQLGFRRIIFNRIENYEPIYLNDWIELFELNDVEVIRFEDIFGYD